MSKLAEMNKKIEESVVGGYKKIENGVVGGFQTDKFVDTYLAKEGESVEDAKERITKEQSEREEQIRKEMEERKAKQDELINKSLEASRNAGKR